MMHSSSSSSRRPAARREMSGRPWCGQTNEHAQRACCCAPSLAERRPCGPSNARPLNPIT